MKITEFSPQDFEKLEKQWKVLEKGAEMTWFQTYDWYKIVNRHFIAEKKKDAFRLGTYVLLSDDKDAPLMIAPIQFNKVGLYVKGIGLKKGFYFIGRQGYSDYLNFIYADFKSEYVEEIFKYLKEKYHSNTFCFENVSSKNSMYEYLDTVNGNARTDSLCMRIVFPEDFEEYRASLAKSVRRNMTTAFNRAAKNDLQFTYEIATSLDKKTIEELREVYMPRYSKKNDRTVSEMSLQAKLYTKGRDLLVNSTCVPVDVLEEIENCWCLIVRCNGEVAAFFYDVYRPENKTVYQLIAGVNEKYQWYGPGKTQLYSFIKDEIESGRQNVEIIDLTRGNEAYKYDFAAEEVTTSQFMFNF